MKLLRGFAHLLSTVFHPLMMPTFGFLIYMEANPYLFANYSRPISDVINLLGWEFRLTHRDWELARVFMLTYFFPAFAVLLMLALKLVDDVDVRDRQKRVLPYIASGFFYIVAFVWYQRTFEWPMFQAILLGSCIAIFSGFLINLLFLKVSAHASGVGGAVAFCMILLPIVALDITPIFMLAILIAGLVGSARMVLGVHSPKELMAGYATGYLSQWVAYFIIV